MPKRSWILVVACAAACGGGAPAPPVDPASADVRVAQARATGEALASLHHRLPAARPGDWLDRHKEEGQTFAEYTQEDPMVPDGVRRRIYVVPVGTFSEAQQRVLDLTVEFVRGYFGLEVVVGAGVATDAVPEHARRTFPGGGWLQLRTTHILQDILRPALPDDAACSIAFCAADLWPGRGWNFVFGEASLRHRVGVWSIYRNGDPSVDEAAFRLCLLRTMKTATHEIGHMFGLRHCILNECNMCGSNHREESDRHPVWLCPECLPKVLWGLEVTDAAGRFDMLSEFCSRVGLETEARHFAASAALLRQ